MVGAVPVGSTLMKLKPANVRDPIKGYMQLSGTSFAAPVVSGAAATLVAQHPTWTPDQVKGALMLTATPEPRAAKGSLRCRRGQTSARHRAFRNSPPNPNAGLNHFVTTAADGTRVFDSAAWQAAARSNPVWDAAAWSDAGLERRCLVRRGLERRGVG